MKNDHRQFLYNGGTETARLFMPDEEIPEGWFDRPNAIEWHRRPEHPENQVDQVVVQEPKQKLKYPSQMNKNELIEFGTDLGLSFDDGMSKREMLSAVNEKIKGDDHEDDDQK